MSSRKLKRLRLSTDIIDRCSRSHIYTCKDLLSKSPLELLKLLGVGIFTVQELTEKCAEACVPESFTALQLYEKRKKIRSYFPSSLPDLDKVLHGGIPFGTITEIAGPAGCGKTQICMMLCVLCCVPERLGGTGGTALYIDTESAFSPQRLLQIGQFKFCEYYDNDPDALDILCSKVLVHREQTCSSLLKRLKSLEEDVISNNVKLVVVDSIASLVRKEFSTTAGKNLTDRTNFLTQEAAILKYIAEAFNIPVVVTNQITTRYSGFQQADPNHSDDYLEETKGGYITAALGNTWSHSVNTRLILQYLDGERRQIMVAKSPLAPFTEFAYTIEKCGIVQEEKGAGHYEGTDPGIQNIKVRSALPVISSQQY